MYRVTKRLEVAGAHQLCLDYESKCQNLHGHNWIITVTCQSETLNSNGMVIDFTEISKIAKRLDHANLNEILKQPTAENIAKWLADQIGPQCVEVRIQESEGNEACYSR